MGIMAAQGQKHRGAVEVQGLDGSSELLLADDPLPVSLRDAYLARARAMPVRKGQIVIAEGTLSSDVYLICQGRVQVLLVSESGREVVLRNMEPHRIFGENAAIDGLPRSARVVAIEDGQLAHMSGPDFVTFLGEVPHAGLWMAQQLAARVRDLTDKTFELATMPVASRIQAELLRMAAQGATVSGHPDRAMIERFPTHAELAARTGTHREAVSRELGQLAQEGLLRQSGRSLEVLSLTGLRSLHERLRR
jgi:CRP/FNR family cyclic AMP-dependent transcriptional regulator